MHGSGTVLAGRYRVVRHVGSGGMGSVYLAQDEVLEREVAVKSVHAEPESDLGRRIMREARLGAGLRHPHLVTVFDVVPEGGALLLVMEYVAGETLADALRRGPLETQRALEVLRAVADALDHAHARGIVHRDVKPANVLLGAGGAIKLADLGIATAEDVTRITRTGGALGTVAYMAPEQFEPGPVTAAVDVYALATVAFEALAGRRAYPGATAFEVFARLREGGSPPDVREQRPDLPEGVARALQRGMASAPEDRPGTAGELVGELEAALNGGGGRSEAPWTEPMPPVEPPATEPAAVPARRPRRRRSALVPLALIGLVGAVVAVVLLSGGDDEPTERQAARTSRTIPATGPQDAPPPGPPTPIDTVREFYMRAAEGDLRGAWRLAGPRMRAEFGNSRQAFEDDLSSLRGIRFERLDDTQVTATSAIVEIETVAEHTDRTDHCTGTLQVVKGRGGRWLVEPHGVRCVAA